MVTHLNGNSLGQLANGNDRYNGQSNGESNIPPVIIPVDNSDGLEFACWNSGQWAPAYVDPRGIVFRSYIWSDLLRFPQLLLTGADFYLSGLASDVLTLAPDDVDDLAWFAEQLRLHFQLPELA